MPILISPSKLPAIVWVLVLYAVLFTPLSSTIISYDGDPAHHALLGKIILSQHAIPTLEPTAITSPDKIFIAHEWLAEVIFATFDTLFGPSGIAFVGAFIFGACLFSVARALERRSYSSLSIVLLIPAILFLARIHFIARPHLFTWLLFILLFLIMDAFRAGKLSVNALLLRLILIFVVWVNLHGSFTLGLLALGILLLTPAVFTLKRPHNLTLLEAAGILFLVVACTYLNPWGTKLHEHVLSFLIYGGEIRKYIPEFGGASLDTAWYLGALILLIVFVVLGIMRQKDIYLEDFLLFAFLLTLTLLSVRMSVYLAFLTPLLISRRNSDEDQSCALAREFSLVIIASAIYLGGISIFPKLKVNFDETLLPVNGVEYLKTQVKVPPSQIFNAYEWGGFIAYQMYPDTKVFIHGLNDHYGLQLLKDYSEIIGPSERSDQLLESHNINWLIFPTNVYLTNRLIHSANWEAIYRDATCVILKRR